VSGPLLIGPRLGGRVDTWFDWHPGQVQIVSKVILKQFTEPYWKKGELLLPSLDVTHPERKIARGGSARFGKIPNYLRFA